MKTDLLVNIAGAVMPGGKVFPEATSGETDTSFYKTLMENLSEGVYFVNNERIITYWNKGAERLTGYAPSQVVGRHCGDNILEHIDEAGRYVCGADCPLRGTIQDGKPRDVELYMRHKLGYRIPVSTRSTAIRNSLGQIVGAIEVFTNISTKKNIERRIGELEDLAYRDSLTGVANRRYAELKLQQATQEVQLFGRRIGLILMDLDRFKEVNDTWVMPQAIVCSWPYPRRWSAVCGPRILLEDGEERNSSYLSWTLLRSSSESSPSGVES